LAGPKIVSQYNIVIYNNIIVEMNQTKKKKREPIFAQPFIIYIPHTHKQMAGKEKPPHYIEMIHHTQKNGSR
jgi:hypothetical protein